MALALQLAANTAADCRDDVCVMRDGKGRSIGLRDRRDGRVLGRWDRDRNFVVEKPKCKFVYSETLETQALLILQQEFGSEVARQYDVAHPGVELHRLYANLNFMGILPGAKGGYLLDPPSLTVGVDVCTGVVKSHHIDNAY